MVSGGKRIGSGRKEKYSQQEKLIILDICQKVWESKNIDTDHVVIHFNREIDNVSFTEIWDAAVVGPDIIEFAAIEEPKTSMKKIIEMEIQPCLQNNLFEKPKSRDQCIKLAQIIISKNYPERFHRANTIDKIWKTRNQ